MANPDIKVDVVNLPNEYSDRPKGLPPQFKGASSLFPKQLIQANLRLQKFLGIGRMERYSLVETIS